MLSPYLFGLLALGVLYALSYVFTHSVEPWALARGHNKELSTSILQFVVFTGVTVFAYATAVAARVMELKPGEPLPPLAQIPLNLLILMGLSVTTTAASKGITIAYLQKNQLSPVDNSSLTANREGDTDLIKVQMLIWTLIAAVVYLLNFSRFIAAKCYLTPEDRAARGLSAETAQCPEGAALPDVDGALLALMGVSQGGYVAGKLVSRTSSPPKVEHVLPSAAKANMEVSLLGGFFGDSGEGNRVLFRDAASNREYEAAPADILAWSDTEIKLKVPAALPPAKYLVRVRANTLTGAGKEFEVTK